MNIKIRGFWAFSIFFATSNLGFAEPVRLYSPDGEVEIFGELLEVEETQYIVQTSLGAIAVERSKVICDGESCPATELAKADVIVRGSDTVGEILLPLLVEGLANRDRAAVAERKEVAADTTHLVVRDDRGQGETLMVVEVQAAGSSTGFRALIDDETDIAMSSRAPKSGEFRTILDQGRGDLEDINQEYIIAVDSILMVVSPENPISELTTDQAARIFSGAAKNWSEFGGPDLDIRVYARPETSGTRAVFEGAILQSGQTLTSDATIMSSNEELAEVVTNDPGGIGYVAFAATRNAKPVSIRLNCGIVANATPFSAKTEEYVLQRRLRLYTDNGSRDPRVQRLLDFAISSEADGLIGQAGFIDLSVVADDKGIDAEALLNGAFTSNEPVALSTLRNMMSELEGARRLSTTFRFASGSSRLDNKAERDIARMVEFIARPENARKQVLVVGFTDSDGDFSANERLSISRAQVVLDAIRNHSSAAQIDTVEMAALGFGELSPVGCNEDFQGRQRNRRVEIWLR